MESGWNREGRTVAAALKILNNGPGPKGLRWGFEDPQGGLEAQYPPESEGGGWGGEDWQGGQRVWALI